VDSTASLDHKAPVILPGARKIVLVMDNLNTHKTTSLYETFAPEEARKRVSVSKSTTRPTRLLAQHGGDRNRDVRHKLREPADHLTEEFMKEVKMYIKSKNVVSKPINWQFTNEQDRIKLKAYYQAN
jgi:hypothetical protein